MKKIINSIKSFNCWLAKFGADRYLHLIVGLIIAFVTAVAFDKVGGESTWTCVGVAMLITAIVGMLKEVADQTFEGVSDGIDWLFTGIGGLLGCALWLL
jgi:hypothetical protein